MTLNLVTSAKTISKYGHICRFQMDICFRGLHATYFGEEACFRQHGQSLCGCLAHRVGSSGGRCTGAWGGREQVEFSPKSDGEPGKASKMCVGCLGHIRACRWPPAIKKGPWGREVRTLFPFINLRLLMQPHSLGCLGPRGRVVARAARAG